MAEIPLRTGTVVDELRRYAIYWVKGLRLELKNLVERVPLDIDQVAVSFAHKLQNLLMQIAVVEHFLSENEDTDSPVRARAQALVDNTLGN